MNTRRGQRGMSGGLVAIVIVLILVGILAAQGLSRLAAGTRSSDQATVKLAALADAIEQFAASAGRLPCPTNPALATTDAGWGDEVLPSPNVGTCTFPEGTIPWRTIGARGDDALDPWGQRVTYRVYTGVSGSLTQTNGASMVHCDTEDSAPGAVTSGVGSEGGLCNPQSRVTLRDTLPASFLTGKVQVPPAKKGLVVHELGQMRDDIAFVLLSHGPSGLGGYTASGTRRQMPPAGSELSNTGSTGPFYISVFSAADVDPTAAGHFDDVVAYRRIEDLIKAAGTYGRNWPEEAGSGSRFSREVVESAVGQAVTSGQSVGQVSVTFTGGVASGVGSGGAAADVTFVEANDGSWFGLGVGGITPLIQSSANELLRLDLERASKFAITLADFGIYSGQYYEIVELRFFLGSSEVGAPRYGIGCLSDGPGRLASFSMNVGTIFDRVDIKPFPAFDSVGFTLDGITAFLVSEVKGCPAADATCTTSLANPGNTCALF